MLIGYRPRGSLAALLAGWAAGLVASFAVLLAVWSTVVPEGAGWERSWLLAAHAHFAGFPYLLAGWVRILGTTPAIASVVVLFALGWLLLGAAWKSGLLVVDAVLLWAVTHFGKDFFARPRPDLFPHAETDFSFPSGHALFAVGFYGFLAYLLAHGARPGTRRIVWIAWALLAVALGGSRIVLGVHWPTDVLAGYLAGLAMLVGTSWGTGRWMPLGRTR